MKTVFVLVDALKSLYLTEENMPFLYSLSKKSYYVREVMPCPGFCERSEIFSGLDGFDTGNFTAIGYMPEHSPYRHDKLILGTASFIEMICQHFSRFLFRRWRIWKKRLMPPYMIPYRSLGCFALTEDGEKQLIPHRTLFQELDNRGLVYSMSGFTSLADLGRKISITKSEFVTQEIDRQADFIPVYIGVTDYAGHLYGGDIDKIRPFLHEVDCQLEEIYQKASKAGYSFCVLGDHGMVPVTKKIDVMNIVYATGCKLHKDYEAFYDSTLARFWFNNQKAYNGIRSILENELSDEGFIVDKNNYLDYRIPLDVKNKNGRPVYGDIVWCALPGVLISPDYFHLHSKSENGMHGYVDCSGSHGTGLFIKMYQGVVHDEIPKMHSSQICGELCELLGIKIPNSKEWKRQI